MVLVTKIYKILENLPKDERFNLVSQIKRCAVSIPSNIAEGAGRDTDKDFNKFLAYSTGSSYELETQLLLCVELFNFKRTTHNDTPRLRRTAKEDL